MRARVGYVGVGLMGHGAARNILEKGWALTVLGHRNRANVVDLVARGAAEAATPEALVAASDVIFLCLPGVAEVEAVIAAMLPFLRAGMIIVDKSTGSPDVSRRLGAMLAQHGVGMVDAPIGRTPKEAAQGRLSSLLGGDAAHVAAVRPIVAAYADTIIEAGPLGAALLVKIVNNFVSFTTALVIGETFAAASTLGVPFGPLCAMIEAGGSNSTMFQWIKPWILEGDDNLGRGRLAGGKSVLDAYRAAAQAGGAPTVLADAAAGIVEAILAAGHGGAFVPHLPGIMAAMAGAPFRPIPE